MTNHINFDRREFCKSGLAAAAGATLAVLGSRPAVAATFEADELCYMSAAELLPSFKARKLSPVDVLESQIARYKKVNEMVNGVTYTHFDSAMKRAHESETRWRNGTVRALEGITCGIKDEHHDAGWIVTQGSVILKDDRKDHADPIVTKLKNAGAVPHIQTTVPEFYLNSVTWTKLWGVSRCPWNLKYAVGGSSGGSGACLAAGMATIATGSDMGRISTASLCLQRSLRIQTTVWPRRDRPSPVVLLRDRTAGADLCRYDDDAKCHLRPDAA